MKIYLREWITESVHSGNTFLDIVEFKNKEELLEDKKQLEEGHPTLSVRYFELKEDKTPKQKERKR